MKKITIVLFCFLLFFTFVSCSQSENSETFDVEINETDNGGWGGLDFTVYSNVYGTDENYVFNFQIDTPLGDEMLSRINGLKEKHDCNIGFIYDSDLRIQLASGIHPADIIYSELGTVKSLASAGLLCPYDDYSTVIDCKNSFKWGTPNLLEATMYKGTLYGLVPAAWVGNIGGFYFSVISNNSVISRFSYANPHEYVENGEWTREKFLEMIVGCADSSSNTYGAEIYGEWWMRMCLYANGVKYLDVNGNGEYTNGLMSEAVIDGLEWATESLKMLMAEKAIKTSNNTDAFYEGNIAFTMESGHIAANIVPYERRLEDYSVLPFPSNPNYVKYGKWIGYLSVDSTAVCIPHTELNTEETAILLNEICEPLGGIENEEDLLDYYANNVFYRRGDAEVLLSCMKNSVNGYIDSGEIFNVFNKLISSSLTQSASEVVGKQSDRAWSDICEYVVPNAEAFEKYFDVDYFEYFNQ